MAQFKRYYCLVPGCLRKWLGCFSLILMLISANVPAADALDLTALTTQIQTAQQQNDYAQAERLYTQGLNQLQTTYALNSKDIQEWIKQITAFYLKQANLAIEKTDYSAALQACNKAQTLIQTTISQLNPSSDSSAVAVLKFALSLSYLIQANTYATQATLGQLQTEVTRLEDWLKQAINASQQSYDLLQQNKAVLQSLIPKLASYLDGTASAFASNLINLANYYQTQEQFPSAATLLQQSQSVVEQLSKDSSHSVFIVAQAQGWQRQGQFAKAENLLKQLLQEQTQANAIEESIITLYHLGILYLTNADYSQAATYLKQGLDLANSTQYLASIQNLQKSLAITYMNQMNYKEAEPLLLASIKQTSTAATNELAKSSEDLSKLLAIIALADNYLFLGDYAKARYYYQVLISNDYSLPITHPASKVEALIGLARAAGLEKNIPLALNYIDNAWILVDEHPNASNKQAELEKKLARIHLWLLELGLAYKQVNSTEFLPIAFKAMQQAHGQARQQVLQKMALRLSANNPQVHQQLQNLWQEQTHLNHLEQQYLLALSDLKPQAIELSNAFQDTLRSAQQDVKQYEQQLIQDFPLYQTLIKPNAIDLSTIQALLANDEALLIWALFDKGVIQQQSYLMVVRAKQNATFYPLAINNNLLKRVLEQPKTGLNTSIADPTKAYDMLLAYGLYQQLMAPAEKDLVGIKHIIAITDGYLQNLPLAALIRSAPTEKTTYQTADWLAKSYAFSYLPSIKALAQLRSLPTNELTPTKRHEFIGFGDPLVQGETQALESIFKQLANQNKRTLQGIDFFPNTAVLRQQLMRLPETAEEIQQAANLFKVDKAQAVYLGERATEGQIKQLSAQGQLKQARVLSFATHALLPQYDPNTPLNAPQEAGLVLTPPVTGTAEDDGYLSASEAAALDLNADWVLLSACNTGVVTPNQVHQGLSQLTQAFFSAGSRSILASQWSVDSSTTEQLMSSLFTTLQSQPQQTKAESLRHSMLQTLNGHKTCNWLCHLSWQSPVSTAHPAYWAAFKLYGEGGRLTP